MTLLEQALDSALNGKCNSEIKPVTMDEVQELTRKELEILHEIMVAPHVTLALHILQRANFFDWLIPEIKESLELRSSKQFKEISLFLVLG